ncbi:hypothetical protein OEZ85_002002 [Tetradesmus obliquus]|uniref:Malonyl-CoA decarboxylase C-terminal domain-containing protein n=1 Tax=Tetradesmus obliquus TaxID=3088 RepID=A0ABY8U1L8_TETOB|nr:hypothetical protein OEZ85_002002 [Tetradesmus obliquus]
MRLRGGIIRVTTAYLRTRESATVWCSGRTHWHQQQQQYTTSVGLIRKWQDILSNVNTEEQSRQPTLETNDLRQLLKDAIHVYKTEGAAAVVPDQVTEVFMAVYSSLAGPQQQLTFFTLLAREFGVQGAAVDAAVQLWQDKGQAQNASPELLYRLADRLTAAAQPLYMQLLLPVSQHKAGIAFLVRLRSDLLQLLREQPGLPQAAALRALSQDLRSALARWFSVGLLQLQRITWEDTPGQLLERVMAAEAVHRMQHLGQLKRRLQQSDRRVFAFLHPSMPREPLVLPEAGQAALQPVLLRLCGRYLLAETRRGWALDPVQHFHLKNGAWLWRINTRADLSAAGLERSCGLMVNYKYVLADVTANNRAYLVDQRIAAAAELRRLLD